MSSKTIVHLYPSVFKSARTKPGLGDFLRGSIFLGQYAELNGLDFKINIANHPLYNYTVGGAEYLYTEAPAEFNLGFSSEEILKYLEDFKASDKTELLVNCNMFYDKTRVSQQLKDYINSVLRFKDIYYETALTFFPTPYEIIHIRTFDHQTDQNIYSFHLNKKVIDSLNNSGTNGKNVIVMSNNILLRNTISKAFNLDQMNTKPAHTAMSSILEDTVLDYIVLSRASKINSLSFYAHGTGFSEQCAFLKNIPNTSSHIVKPEEYFANSLPNIIAWNASVEFFLYSKHAMKYLFDIESKEYTFNTDAQPSMRLWEFVNDSNKQHEFFFKERMGYGVI
jgi:hypothetical protein